MVSQIAQVGVGFVDASMAGHASALDLAAVSIGSSVWIALMVTFSGVLMAVSPLVAHQVGARNFSALPGLAQQSLWLGLVLGGIGMLLAWLAQPLFFALHLPPEVARRAAGFLAAASWSFPALAVSRVLANYSSSLNYSRPLMVIALLALFLNIPLNALFIYGYGPVPAMGGIGCGYATAISQWFAAIAFAVWLRWAPVYRELHPFRQWRRPDWACWWAILRLGAPIGLVFFVEVSAFSLIALLMAPLGQNAIAAHQIALNFTALVFMVPSALGVALTVRVGQALGAGEPSTARRIGYLGLLAGLGFALVSAITIMSGREAIARLYTTEPAVLVQASRLLLLVGIFQLADASQAVLAGILRGYQITRSPMAIYIAAFWGLAIPLGYWLALGSPHWGAAGFWCALVLGLLLAALALWWRFWRVSRLSSSVHPA